MDLFRGNLWSFTKPLIVNQRTTPQMGVVSFLRNPLVIVDGGVRNRGRS